MIIPPIEHDDLIDVALAGQVGTFRITWPGNDLAGLEEEIETLTGTLTRSSDGRWYTISWAEFDRWLGVNVDHGVTIPFHSVEFEVMELLDRVDQSE